MAGNGIPLVARRLREMLTQKKSMSARTVSEYDGDAAQSVEKEQVGTNFLFNGCLHFRLYRLVLLLLLIGGSCCGGRDFRGRSTERKKKISFGWNCGP